MFINLKNTFRLFILRTDTGVSDNKYANNSNENSMKINQKKRIDDLWTILYAIAWKTTVKQNNKVFINIRNVYYIIILIKL